MSKHSKEALSELMKKQMSEKSTKKTIISNFAQGKGVKKKGGDDFVKNDLSDEELLQEAKKESNSKAVQNLNLELIKKIIINRIIKYGAIIVGSGLIALALIKVGPAFLAFLKKLFYYFFMSSFG